MKATRAELAARLREEQARYEALERCWVQAKDLAIKSAGDRDAAMRTIDQMREAYDARIESMFVDLRERTRERDAAQTETRKYAETRRLADDLQAELAAAKIALGKRDAEVDEWKASFDESLRANGAADERAVMLADLVVSGSPGAVHVAKYILDTTAEPKPCAP